MFYDNEVKSNKPVEIRHWSIPVHELEINNNREDVIAEFDNDSSPHYKMIEYYQHFIGLYTSNKKYDYLTERDNDWGDSRMELTLKKLFTIHLGKVKELEETEWPNAIKFLCPRPYNPSTITNK